MSEKLVQHKHCSVCGKAMPPELETCSEKCGIALQALIKKKRMWIMMFYAAMGVFIITLFL